MSAPTKAERDELRRLTAESGQWVTKGRWEIGGPYPSTSVIVCIDPGSTHPDCAEEPTYEPICIVDQRTQGEPNRPARAIAAEIAATHNALPGLLDYIDALEAAIRNAGFATIQASNGLSIHDVSEKAKADEERTAAVIVRNIELEQRVKDLEAETDSLGVTADDEAEAHQETLFLLENAKHRIEALEAALRPFAAIADKHAAAAKYLECPEKDDDAPVVVPIGYCRHAREVVKEKA